MQDFVRHDGDGFRLARPTAGGRCVLNLAHWSSELDAVFRDNVDIHVVQQAPWVDGGTPILARLARYVSQIHALTIGREDAGDLGILNEFTQLEQLTLGQPTDAIDFGLLSRLRAVSLNPGATLGRVTQAPTLESIELSSVPIRELAELSHLRTLRRLVLRQILSLKSLDGIEVFPLEHLALTYINRLTSVKALCGLQHLRSLQIDGASKALDGDAISRLGALEVLELDNGPALPSLEGFGAMPFLMSMRVLNTPIGSGPCSISPLSNARTLRQLHLCGEKRSLENLIDIDRLGSLINLQQLALDHLGDVPTLAWIRNLVQLESFALGGGRLVDGDVSALFDLPSLIYVDITARGIKRTAPEYQELKRRVSARGEKARGAHTGGARS